MTFWRLRKLEDAAEVLEFLYESSTELVGEMDDLTVWAAGRLRDVRERKIAFFNYERHAIVASTTSKQPPQPLQESHDDDSQIMSDCIAGEASDQEWSLVQLVEQSEAEFGQLDSDTLQAKHNLVVFYEDSETFVKAGLWYEKLYHHYKIAKLCRSLSRP